MGFVQDWDANAARLAGTYDPSQEHDNCGVGMVICVAAGEQQSALNLLRAQGEARRMREHIAELETTQQALTEASVKLSDALEAAQADA